MGENSEQLLAAILATVGRQAFPAQQLAEIVGDGKQLASYNMCDGSRTQSEIAKAHSLDSGNFSRTVARWIEAGVLFRIGDKKDARLLHIYPLPSSTKARTPRK